MIRGKSVSRRSSLYRNLQLGVGGLVVVSILIGWSGGSIGGRLDLTENRLFTLDDATVELLRELDDIVTIKLFVSEDPPVQVALTQRDVEDLLEDIVNVSNGNVNLVKYLADQDEETAEEASPKLRAAPINFSEQTGGEFKVKVGYLGIGYDLREPPRERPIRRDDGRPGVPADGKYPADVTEAAKHHIVPPRARRVDERRGPAVLPRPARAPPPGAGDRRRPRGRPHPGLGGSFRRDGCPRGARIQGGGATLGARVHRRVPGRGREGPDAGRFLGGGRQGPAGEEGQHRAGWLAG